MPQCGKEVPSSDFVNGGCSWHIQILSVMFLFQESALSPLWRPVAPIRIRGREPGRSGRPMDAIAPRRTAAPQQDTGWEDRRAGCNLDNATTLRVDLLSQFWALFAPRPAPTLAGRRQQGPAAAGRPFVAIGVRVPKNWGRLPDVYPSCMTWGDVGSTPGITLGFKAQL
jgi:hypothetical protein